MPPARPRPPRPTPADRRAEEPWGDEAPDAVPPLLALVDAAVDALDLDQRQLAEAMGFGAAAFRGALATPDGLERRQLARLAVLLGVDSRAVYAAASAAATAAARDAEPEIEPETELDGDDAPRDDAPTHEPLAAATDVAQEDAVYDTHVEALPGAAAVDETPRDTPRAQGRRRARVAPAPSAAAAHAATALADDGPALAESPIVTPPSLAATLERTIAAVVDDALGRRVRLAILATVQTAAAEAGRRTPPELHELRRRVQAGELPWVGEGAIVIDERGAGADDALLAAAAALVREVQGTASGYADLFAPVHDDALGELLRRLTVSVRGAALGATSACVVTPPLYGRYLLVCSADATAEQRRLALRRGVAHVLAGHVGEVAPLPLPAPPDAERLADLVALADLVPFWQLEDLRRQGRLGWRALTDAVARTCRALAGDWADERADDRAMLRVRLYRAYRI